MPEETMEESSVREKKNLTCGAKPNSKQCNDVSGDLRIKLN